ncbi:MAG: nascent polypeptide-associated complex protein [Methanomassiliicoccaceae archaeon]|jgi:nascent polypeptide-associated complex subunit alpha|nr:nascent polypeptide-associated complex protein [Methanomassiliicoccaceae archaeon]
MSGMGRINPRQMKQAMKKMGIRNSELKDVVEVIIRMPNEELVFKYPEVSLMEVQGSKTYQINGEPEPRPLGSADDDAGVFVPAEDVELVMSQTGCDKETAVKALQECNGQPAEAIIKIISS